MRVVALAERAWFGVTTAGGAEVMGHLLMQHLAAQGWEAHAVVCDGQPTTAVVDGVNVTVCRDKHQVHELFKTADLVITYLGATPRARAMGRLYGIPVVQLIHNTSDYSVGFLGEGCDYAIYNSQWVKDHHETLKAVPVIKSWQHNKLVNMNVRRCFEWPSMVIRPPVLHPFPGHGAGPKGFITLINLVPNKGPDVFYDLAVRHPDLHFMAVVGGYEPDNQDIRALPNVVIQNHVHDVDEFYAQTAVVLMPSKYESYGLVAVEAMGRGIPVIASPTPGLKECMGSTGIYRDREDLDGWSSALKGVLSNYSSASHVARMRHAQLYKKSQSELVTFEQNMRKVVEEWRSSLSVI